jgi:hypothetical protein
MYRSFCRSAAQVTRVPLPTDENAALGLASTTVDSMGCTESGEWRISARRFLLFTLPHRQLALEITPPQF